MTKTAIISGNDVVDTAHALCIGTTRPSNVRPKTMLRAQPHEITKNNQLIKQ